MAAPAPRWDLPMTAAQYRAALVRERVQKITDRQNNLRALWQAELRNDADLLRKPWEPANVGQTNMAEPFTDIHIWANAMTTVDGRPYFVLRDLQNYVEKRLGDVGVRELDALGSDPDNEQMDGRPFFNRGIGDDKAKIVADDAFDIVRTLVQNDGKLGTAVVDLTRLLPWPWTTGQTRNTFTNPIQNQTTGNRPPDPTLWTLYPNDALLKQIEGMWHLWNRLRIMRRFADGRNPELLAKPLPDGSNIPPNLHPLATAWVLHRFFIRALHYRTLKHGNLEHGRDHLQYDNCKLSLGLLLLELKDVPLDPVGDQQNEPRYRMIPTLYDQLTNALFTIGKHLSTETRQDGRNYTAANTRVYNLETTRLTPVINAALASLDPIWKLWSAILSVASEFEDATDTAHVEDVLISKRVVIEDEWFTITNHLLNPNYNARYVLDEVDDDLERDEREMYHSLQRTGEINRLRRNKLLLTDWSGSRPWKQLYIMFDTSPEGQPEFLGLVNTFWVKLERIQRNEPLANRSNPSNRGNVWPRLFPILPLASTDAPSEDRLGKPYDSCSCFCMDDFKDTCNRVLVRLHCEHWFHFNCIRECWDKPDMISFRCPMCRTSNVDWKLHEHAGITPENPVLDVWDYEEISGPTWIFGNAANDPHPDMNDQYNRDDREQLLSALHFDEEEGYPAIQFGDPNAADPADRRNQIVGNLGIFNRIPRIEMAVMRKRRRTRHKDRIALMQRLKRGYESMQPADQDALGE